MQEISGLISDSVRSMRSMRQSAAGPPSETKLYRDPGTGERLTLTEILWKRLAGLYGNQLTRKFGSKPTPEWELVLARLGPKAIATGLNRLVGTKKHRTFVPTPMEFLDLCLPTAGELGLPSFEVGFHQAVNWGNIHRRNKTPAVLHVLQGIADPWGWRAMGEPRAREVFERGWQTMIEYVAGGGELPEIPDALRDESAMVSSKTERLAMMVKMREELTI